MAALARLQALAPSVVAEYFEKSRAAEAGRAREGAAALKIQSAARGFLVRHRIRRLAAVAVTVQRCWRGYLGRLRAAVARDEADRALRKAYFDAAATTVQSHWRGYHSRKTKFDFAARRSYLVDMARVNQDTRAMLAEEEARASSAQRESARAHGQELFSERVGSLHHLLSTSNQPGIFNSPYAVATGTVPVVAGITLEEHLRAGFKAHAATLPPIKKGSLKKGVGVYPETAVIDGRTVPSRITLRQAAPFEAAKRASQLEDKVNRAEMLSVHPMAFNGSSKKPFYPPLDPQTNRNAERYSGPLDPTTGARSDKFTPVMAKVADNLFLKYQHKQPFFDPLLYKESY
ncbi:hypothetical protein FOA52_000878 [Chlamydomonas sp. UWO 241]|nr:hypothetical protein FOA52_000878 [Chlamydomonas sp. UWO 241]